MTFVGLGSSLPCQPRPRPRSQSKVDSNSEWTVGDEKAFDRVSGSHSECGLWVFRLWSVVPNSACSSSKIHLQLALPRPPISTCVFFDIHFCGTPQRRCGEWRFCHPLRIVSPDFNLVPVDVSQRMMDRRGLLQLHMMLLTQDLCQHVISSRLKLRPDWQASRNAAAAMPARILGSTAQDSQSGE